LRSIALPYFITSFFNLLHSLKDEVVRRRIVGFLPKDGFLRLDLYAMCYFPPVALPFLGRAFGGIRIF
jgi:hypothetical protein